MTAIPEPYSGLAALIDRAHEAKPDKPRPHLGCSMVGHHCERWIWLSFRWAVREKFPGRILRLFRRGHDEEKTIYDDLQAAGVKVFGAQTLVDFGGHVSGSTDGEVEGVPGGGNKRHLLECKTHAKKSFDDLAKNGVEKSKPQHWAQMQVYMRGRGLDRALYYAICKNDDRIYTERIRYDEDAADTLIKRGHRLALAERMPDPISTDPSWYLCKFCAAHEFCHKTKMTREINCRTCAHVTPERDGTWSCARWDGKNIPYDFQLTGCGSHVLHPDLVPWEMADSNDPHEAVYMIDGEPVRNGESDAHVLTSRELVTKIYDEEVPF